MYQYAFGLYLAYKNKTQLKYHYTNALFNTQRQFELNVFSITATEAADTDLKALGVVKNRIANRILYLLDDRYKIQLNKHIHTQRYPYTFDKKLRSIPDNSYIQGYFADKRYFAGVENIVQSEFTLKNHLDKKNADLIQQMRKVNSVSIHVRRGDYITNKNNPQFIGIEYYLNKLKEIETRIKKPHYFIFSDDMNWCRMNLSFLKHKTFVDFNKGKESYKDMVLMSNCKYNIVANSTFSEWSAILNSNLSDFE
jgi:hypothetical protein